MPTGEADSLRAAGAQELFREKHYVDLDGGILEGFGRLLKFDLKLYVYPTLDDSTGELMTADNIKARAALPNPRPEAARVPHPRRQHRRAHPPPTSSRSG